MDRIAVLIKLQWRAYWRRAQRAGHLTRNNVGVLVLVAGLGVIKYVQQIPAIANELAHGTTRRFEKLLALMFLLCMLPILSETRRSISSRELLQFPLTTLELYSVRLISVFISPLSWLVGACSIVLIYPVWKAANPIAGIVALLVFLFFALFTALVVSDLLTISRGRWALLSIAVAAVSCAVVVRFFAGGPPDYSTRLIKSLLPHYLVSTAAVSSQSALPLLALLGMTAVGLALSVWVFGLGLYARQRRRARRVSLLSSIEIPGKFFGLLKKDIRYACRLLDLYLALPLVVLFNIYLASNSAPSPIAFWLGVTLLVLPFISLAFNSFGLDSRMGLDRYALLPLSSRETLISKNLAFGLVTFVLFSTMLPLAIWRLGLVNSLLGFLILVSIQLAFMSYGNWLSVNQPFKMQIYRFASGSPFDAMMGIIVGSLPGVVSIFFLKDGDPAAVLKVSLVILVCLTSYLLSLRWSARVLERRWELISASLAL
jgi:hypothetical protein